VHAHIEFDFHTRATPEQVVELLTDFSPNRPQRWPQLSAKWYEVYSVGSTEADVREGQVKPSMWAKEHYDWSTPGKVTWTVTESEALAPGSYVSLEAKPGADGGSDVHGVWDRTAVNGTANIAAFVMRFAGRKILTGYLRKVFDGVAGQAAAG
jgi:hypothetical protein